MNALIVGDQTLRKYDKDGNLNENYLFDKENMIDTFLGVALLGGTISSIKTLGYTNQAAEHDRMVTVAKEGLKGKVSEDEMAILDAFLENPFGADYANVIPFFEEGRDEESKKAVGRYMSAVIGRQGYMLGKGVKLAETQQGLQEL
jgi:hypothetical protein